jgi:hypothetical protein
VVISELSMRGCHVTVAYSAEDAITFTETA